jgi:hypothetical protein
MAETMTNQSDAYDRVRAELERRAALVEQNRREATDAAKVQTDADHWAEQARVKLAAHFSCAGQSERPSVTKDDLADIACRLQQATRMLNVLIGRIK